MKKLLFAIALIITMSLGANAQKDGFFGSNADNEDVYRNLEDGIALPNVHGSSSDFDAPMGSGLLIMTALGAGYALRRKNK
ncbi:MAG: hypothetical protein J6X10_06580 [Bacteroidales bacterium]|nr:hypothetical protein [Bacteroidales bacterium]